MKKFYQTTLKKLLWICVGQFIATFAFSRILAANDMVSSGLGGLGIVINRLTGVNMTLLLVLMATPIFVWSFFCYDRRQIFFAAFSYSVFTFYNDLMVRYMPAFKTDMIVACIAGGVLMGIGVGITMKQRMANGPEAIVSLYLKEKRGLSVGNFFFIMNGCIICSSILYGNLTFIIYSLISTYVQSIVTDYVILAGEKYYNVNIMSDHYLEITDYISKELHRNVVFVQGMDTSNVKKKMLLQAVVNKQEMIDLKEYIKEFDDDSFVYAAQSTAVIGKGFYMPE